VTEEIIVTLQAGEAGQQYCIRTRNQLTARLIEIQASATWRVMRPIIWCEKRFPIAIRAIALFTELLSAALRGNLIEYLRLRRDVKAIHASGLFNAAWYAQRYPEVVFAGIDPVVHYLTDGAKRGYWPSQNFDPISYLAYYDPTTADTNPLLDYMRRGSPLPAKGPNTNVLPSLPNSLREKILASNLFDPEWYITTYSDVKDSNYDPLFHYIKKGWREGYAPSKRFNGQLYLQCHPEVLKAGLNPLLHFILYGDPSDPSNEPFANCLKARQTIAAMIEHTHLYEPQLNTAEVLSNINSLCCYDGQAIGVLFDTWRRIFSELDRPYDRIVCMSRPELTDMNPFLNYVLRAVIDRHGTEGLLIIITDTEHKDHSDLLPRDVARIGFSDYAPYLTFDHRASLVEIIIRALKPKTVLNIGSFACWEAIRRHGLALSTCCDFFVLFTCQENSPNGRFTGNEILYFRDCIPSIRKVYVDNARLQQHLIDQFGVPNSLKPRIAVVPQPVSDGLKARGLVNIEFGMPLRVFWVGPFDRQDNIAILPEIVALAVNLQLDLYLSASDLASEALSQLAGHPGQIRIMGAYTSIEAIPTANYGAFLFTAQWGSIPSVLLEAAALGVPIVAPDVGGIGELIDDDTGWLIHNYQDAFCYVNALEQIRRSPHEAQRRVDNLVERINTLHNWSVFLRAFSLSPSFID
jgi:glycosyltransferase involved in cell wall biosynthesis